MTGATGFIGRALVPALRRDGHTLVAWTRSESRARTVLGPEVEAVRASGGPNQMAAAVEGCDAVVNLAGEPILGRRWTAARRAALRESRVGLTAGLVRAVASASARPRVLVSGSAVGYYGDRGDEILAEDSPRGTGFLADLCEEWEEEANRAGALGVRVVTVRTGVVVGPGGGALVQMLPAFRLGLGGPIGSGRQYLPWVHVRDVAAIVVVALADDRLRGPVNGVGPNPATGGDFARAIGRALGRPAVLPVPSLALRAIFGQASEVLLSSQRVVPAALERIGFRFALPNLDAALTDSLGRPES